MISLLPSFLIPILDKNSFILLIYTLIWFLFGLIFFYLKINPHAKNKLPEISNHQVQPNNKFFRHWANESYEEYQLKKSYEVIKKTTLSSDSQLNTDLLQEYSEYFDKKAGQKILTEMAKYIGGLILLFLIPFWNQFLAALYRLENGEKILEASNLGFKILLIIIVIILAILPIRLLFDQVEESKDERYRRISKKLITIRWNLLIENSAKNHSE